MSSLLIITSVEGLQKEINSVVRDQSRLCGIYVSLNKPQKSAEESLAKSKIDTRNMFFIDCVTTQAQKEDVPHLSPKDLDKLGFAISSYIHEIPEDKYLLIDALSTLLIYNNENRVAQFVKQVTEFSAEKGVNVIALSPRTQGEDLLNKVYNFFDEVKGNK